MKKCNKCGKELSNESNFCDACGSTEFTNIESITNNNQRTCPKCGGTNISYQRETVGNIGGSFHSFSHNKKHGCLYFLIIGWWIWIFKFIFGILKIIMTGGLSLLFRKNKNKTTGKTISASKSINRTVAICQNCGNTWKI